MIGFWLRFHFVPLLLVFSLWKLSCHCRRHLKQKMIKTVLSNGVLPRNFLWCHWNADCWLAGHSLSQSGSLRLLQRHGRVVETMPSWELPRVNLKLLSTNSFKYLTILSNFCKAYSLSFLNMRSSFNQSEFHFKYLNQQPSTNHYILSLGTYFPKSQIQSHFTFMTSLNHSTTFQTLTFPPGNLTGPFYACFPLALSPIIYQHLRAFVLRLGAAFVNG